MGIILKVAPEELVRMAGDIEKQIADVEKQFMAIETEISRTKGYWEGDASDAHKAQYDALKDDLNQAVKRMKEHPVNLLRMAELYTETEDSAEETAQSLPEDVIV